MFRLKMAKKPKLFKLKFNFIFPQIVLANMQEKEITPTKEIQIVEPDRNYDGLSKVIVDKIPDEYIIPSGNLEINQNGTFDVTDKVNAIVNVPEKKLGTKTITTNGTYKATDDSLDGYSEVEVATSGGSVDEYFKSTIYAGEGETYPGYVNSILKLPPFTFSGMSSRYMFSRYQGTQIMFDDNFDTSSTTSMQYMFNECINLISLDLSGFNTSNVTNMNYMFYHCSSLTSLDLSSFNTSRVVYMASLFAFCSKLVSLNVSNFNTSHVTNMAQLFNGCSSLISLDLSSFNTSKVTNMSTMFQKCTSLQNLNISNFDFTNVTNYTNMFNNVPTDCYILVKDATAKEWITSKFTNLTNVHYVGEEG